MCTPTLTAALFTVAKTWKQLKRLSTDEWIKKMWGVSVYVYKTQSSKKNETLSSEATWKDLEILSEVRESQRQTNII